MRQWRYEYLLEIIKVIEPESIIEIGVAKGTNAVKMLKAAGRNVKYIGYDVFDFTDKAFHKKVGNGKEVWSREKIKGILTSVGNDVSLVKGLTQDTLWKEPKSADLVFLDGDHRIDAIRGDFKAVTGSRVVVFDDFYVKGDHQGFTRDKYGCYDVVSEMDVLITPETIKMPDIRMAIWTEDHDLRDDIEKVLK